ncbi:MAG: hypothetical protein JO362_15780 [Streptomycetaceae bacterium]|nr:hypothetical protein [Streptomycetaceae bacterium]
MTTAEVALPSQAGELSSVDQLDPEERAKVQRRRATRVLRQPEQQLAGLSSAEQLAECERLILEADREREESLREARERTVAAFFDKAGPYLMWVREHELYRLDDPARTFEAWARKTLGYKSSHTYLIMDAVEVRAGLGLAGSEDYKVSGIPLNTGHVRALAPAIRSAGAEVAPKMWGETLAREGKVTEVGLRETWRRMASEASEESNKSFELADLAAERRAVNDALDSMAKQLDGIVERIAGLTAAGVAPSDPAAAEKAVKRIKAAGRWLSGNKVYVPEDTVVEAEVVEN